MFKGFGMEYMTTMILTRRPYQAIPLSFYFHFLPFFRVSFQLCLPESQSFASVLVSGFACSEPAKFGVDELRLVEQPTTDVNAKGR